ncbi:MAG: hypothetical protein AAGJ79_10610 [Verrucomicrobiota bacterium]
MVEGAKDVEDGIQKAKHLQSRSKKWFLATQLFIFLAGFPLIICFIGVTSAFFAAVEFDMLHVQISLVAFALSAILFCPVALFCFLRWMAARGEYKKLASSLHMSS